MTSHIPLVKVLNITKTYKMPGPGGRLHALKQVSFDVFQNESFALVGESGSGKSTLAKLIAGLEMPDQGKILYRGRKPDFANMAVRKSIQMVFQDPYSSLNPRMTVERMFREIYSVYQIGKKKKIDFSAWVEQRLDEVGLSVSILGSYPFQLSGGQRQRVAIARTLSVEPELLILDEPTASLDVSVQAQILDLFQKIQKEKNKTYIFISHNLATVEILADRIGILLNGYLMELGPAEQVFSSPRHPYTQLLLETSKTIIGPDDDVEEDGSTISVTGCPFYPRCRSRMSVCKESFPKMKQAGPDHFVACYR
jgi:oligopeptide/dipeptide ABC transporter ATP-binding protein